MNRFILIFFITLFGLTSNSIAQELKSKTVTKSLTIETFTVLKSDKKVRHGSYKKITTNDRVLIEGQYSNSKRVGVWKFYDYRSGFVEQEYDYDQNKFVYLNAENSEMNHIKYNGEWRTDRLDTVPILIGGLNNLRYELIQAAYSFTDPPKFPKGGIAIFSFVIKANGETTDFKIRQSSDNSFEKYLLKLIEKRSENWLPGVYKGEKVDVEFILPMNIVYKENTPDSKLYRIDFNYPDIVINTLINNR